MLRSRIIPCLLMQDGGLVKGRQFADHKYVGDPMNAVKIFNEKEVDELAYYDIGASAHGTEPDYALLKDIAAESRMPLCYGGGITSAQQASSIISIGFEKISVSSAAIARPELIAEIADAIGRQSVVVTIDVRKAGLFGKRAIFTHNGKRAAKAKPIEFARLAEELGAGEVVLNDIDREGMQQGYDLDLARELRAAVSLPITILGGAGNTGHMAQLIDAVGPVGAAAGSMFVFNGKYRAVLISYARP